MRTRTADRGIKPFFERNTFSHRGVALKVQDGLPHLYGLFRVHAMRADNEEMDRRESLWHTIHERWGLHEHWRAISSSADKQHVCARLLYKAVVRAEHARAEREHATVEDVVRPSLVLRRPGEQWRSYYRLSNNPWLVDAVFQLFERASVTPASGTREDVEEGIVSTFARVFDRVAIDLRVDEKDAIDAACEALVVYARTVFVRLEWHDGSRHHEGREEENAQGAEETRDSDLFKSKDPPTEDEARLASRDPLRALRGFLAMVHTRGSQVERDLCLFGDERESSLKEAFSVDARDREETLRNFQMATSDRQPIHTCASCSMRGIGEDSVHRVAEKIEAARYTDRDGEVYEAASAYPITFSQFGVELTLADLFTVFVAQDGKKYKLNPHVVNAAPQARHERDGVREGDHTVKLCGTCARVADCMKRGETKKWLSLGLIQGDDFGDVESFWMKFMRKVAEDVEFEVADFKLTRMEVKALGLARVCAHQFRINAGFNAERRCFKGHTIAFVNRHRDASSAIRLMTKEEFEQSAQIHIVGCEQNGRAAVERLRQEFTGAIEVREKTLYIWYELIRQLRCQIVVADRLDAMRNGDHARLLRETIFSSLFDDALCANARLFDAYAAEIPFRDWCNKARDAVDVLMRRAVENIDSSELARRNEEIRAEKVADVADVRNGDALFENTFFIYDENEERNPSTTEILRDVRDRMTIGRGGNPLGEWDERNRTTLFEAMFPHVILFPGAGRKIQPRASNVIRTCAMFLDKRFTKESTLLWYLYDSARRIEVWKGAAVSVTADKADQVREIFRDPNFDDDLTRAIRAESEGARVPESVQRVLSLLDVQWYQKMPFTDALRRKTRSRLLDLERFYGPSCLFWTIAPDDKSSALMLRLSAESRGRVDQFPDSDRIVHEDGRCSSFVVECALSDLSTNSFLQTEFGITNVQDLQRVAAENPVATTLVFERLISAFVTNVLGVDHHHSRSTQQRALARPGLFGKASGTAYVLETNGRECLHAHGLLYGTDVTAALLRRVGEQERNAVFARDWIDKNFSVEVQPSIVVISAVMKRLHVSVNALKSIALAVAAVETCASVQNTEKLGSFCASLVNVHKHCESCFKGGRDRCRFGMPRFHGVHSETRSVTIKHEQVEEVTFPCPHLQRAFAPDGTGLNLYPDTDVKPTKASWGRPREEFEHPIALMDDQDDSQIWIQRCRFLDTMERWLTPPDDHAMRLEDINSFDALIAFLRRVQISWSQHSDMYSAVNSVVPFDQIVDACEQKRDETPDDGRDEWFSELHDELRCINAYVSPYNPVVTAVAPHNSSLNFLSSPTDCRLASFYLSKYLSKEQTANLHPLETLRHIRQQRCQRVSSAPDAGEASREFKFTASRLANATMSHREVADTVVVAWALNVESDHFSNAFVFLNSERIMAQAHEAAFADLEAESDPEDAEDSEMNDEESHRSDLERWFREPADNGEDDLEAAFRMNARESDEEGGDSTDHDSSDSDSDYRYDSDDAAVSSSEETVIDDAERALQRFQRQVQRTRAIPHTSFDDGIPIRSRLRVTAGGVMPDTMTLVNDYVHKPEEFTGYSVVEFASLVQKVKNSEARGPSNRERLPRYKLKSGHPQATTHVLVLRAKFAVPAWVGKCAVPSILAKTDSAQRRLKTFVLVFFKPWSSIEDLQATLLRLDESYSEFMHSLQTRDASFINQARYVLVRNVLNAQHVSSVQRVLFKSFRDMCAEKAANVKDAISKCRSDLATDFRNDSREENDERVDEVAFNLVLDAQAEPRAGAYRAMTERIASLIDHGHQRTIRTRAADARIEFAHDHVQLADGKLSLLRTTLETYVPGARSERVEYAPRTREPSADVQGLSNDQRVAFDYAMQCFNSTNRAPNAKNGLLVLGGPGTGKTYFINTLRGEVERTRGCTFVVAPSAAAATLHRGGTTAHKAFGLSFRGSRSTRNNIDALAEKLRELIGRDRLPLAMLVIDEVSMFKMEWLARVDDVLRKLGNSDEPYGGTFVLCAGDFKQLPPVGGKSVAGCLQEDLAYDDRRGANLLTNMPMIPLTTQVRASNDPRHTERIEGCRREICAEKSSLEPCLQSLEHASLVTVDDTVVVLTNASRRAFNYELALAQAKQDDSYMLVWHEKLDSITEPEAKQIYRLEGAVSNALCGFFVPNMPAVLDKNINVALHVVNSSRGIMRRVIYENVEARVRVEQAIQRVIASRDASGTRNAYIVDVEMDAPDGIAFELVAPSVDWPPDMSLDDSRIVIPVMATKAEKPIQFVSHSARMMNERRIHMVKIEVSPAYAFTAWKSQGQTFENRVVLCLWPEEVRNARVSAEALYVVLSRVRSSSQLKYLPHNSVAARQPWFVRWEHALGLEFDRSVDAFLRSYVIDPHARGTFHFDAEKFAQLMQQPPLRISKDVRYNRALDMACEADRRDAPERRRQAKRARVHL